MLVMTYTPQTYMKKKTSAQILNICVSDCQKATLNKLSISVTCFPNVIPQEDITQLETEFLEYQ